MTRFLLATAILIVAAPAQARDDRPGRVDTTGIARLHVFASCIATRRADEARALLMLDPQSSAYRRRIHGLADRHHGCAADGALRMQEPLFSGALAETRLEAELGSAPLATRVAYDPQRPAIRARDTAEGMSLCTVRTAPDQVAAVLASEPASEAEAVALQALAPTLGTCLQRGAQAGLNRPGLRAVLALAAYRLHRHNMDAGPAAP